MKSLFAPADKQEIIVRIQSLTPETQGQWGKMNVAQMLKHCTMPLQLALTNPKPKASFLLKLFGPMFKNSVVGPTPYKKNLFTPKEFMIVSHEDFETQKQALLSLINKFTIDNISDPKHPVFGKLTELEWGHSQYKHLNHHLTQFGV
jgi:Protein of unknown function (DUF1569)